MSIQNLIQDMPGQASQGQVKLPSQTGNPQSNGIGGSIAAVKSRVMPLLAQNPRPPYSAIMSQIPANTDMTSVIAGINSAMKDVMQKEGAQRQAAMQQAAAGGPNVAQQTMMGLQQFLAPRQMPMMAGGGIVALRDGGAARFQDAGVLGLQNPEYDEEGLPRTNEERLRIERNNRIFLAQQKNAEALKQRQAQLSAVRETSQPAPRQMTDYYRSTGRDKAVTRGIPEGASAAAATVPMYLQDTRGGTPEMAALAQMLGTGSPAPVPGTGSASASASQRVSGSAGGSDLDALLRKGQADIDKGYGNVRSLLENDMLGPSPDVVRARQGLMGLYEQFLPEMQQYREAQKAIAEKRFAEAQARANRPGYEDVATLGAILGRMKGAKTFGQALAGAGEGAGVAETARQEALRKAEERYDLSQRDQFVLRKAEIDVQKANAELKLAYATGDDAKIREARFKLAEAENARLQAQNKYAIDIEQLRTGRMSAEAQRLSAQKATAQESLIGFFRRDPEGFKKFIEAQQEPKTEGSVLKALVTEAIKNPLLLSQYPPEMQTLVRNEILKLGVTGTAPAGKVRD